MFSIPDIQDHDFVLMSINDLCFYSSMMRLNPAMGRMLVELRDQYAHVATTEGKYDTKTSGICVSVTNYPDVHSSEYYQNLVGKLVFWEEYKDGATIERDGKRYAFIKLTDVDGWEE